MSISYLTNLYTQALDKVHYLEKAMSAQKEGGAAVELNPPSQTPAQL